MAYESFIGLRYLMAKRQKSVLSIITIISIVGVALGVTALIVVLSVMSGFKKDLMQKILGTKAHIVLKHADLSPVHNSVALANSLILRPEITGASPFVEAEAMVSSPTNLSGIVLRGIDIDHVVRVTHLDKDLQEGKLHYLLDPDPLLKQLDQERFQHLSDLRKQLRQHQSTSHNATNTTQTPPLDSEDSIEAFIADIPEDDTMPGLFDTTEPPSTEPPTLEPPSTEPQAGSDKDIPSPSAPSSSSSILHTIIIGAELAKNLQVKLGDEINVVTPNGGMGPTGPIPKSRPFVIVGIFFTGMYEFDSNYAYTSLESAKAFVGIDGAMGIELRTINVEESPAYAAQLRTQLGPSFLVMDWEELNKSLFFALKIEKLAMFVVLTFIILVASFSIVAMLIMIVIEKGREISILKSMGATNQAIMRIFIFQGSLIGVLGSTIGLGFGISICLFLKYVGVGLDSQVYYISTLPVDMNPFDISTVILSAMLISILATLYPAYQASILSPVDGLRYD